VEPASAEDQAARFRFAVDAARSAAALTLGRFRDPKLRIDHKLDRTLVTEADSAAELQLRAAIEARFPDDGIVGEEHGTRPERSGWTWYLDPIDGTQAYARGVPLFGTLVGVTLEDESRIGVIALPALGEMVYAARGEGCFWQPSPGAPPERTRVSQVSALDQALFCTTWMQSFKQTGRVELFSKLCDATGVFRGWGDCYGYALVATGRAEIMVDPMLAPWDAGPMPVILEEAGGRYTSFEGAADIHAGSGVGTNGLLHEAVLEIVRACGHRSG
jgi:histidinol phosphatase-like enzyme (inositol monophosphatase family)